MTDDLANQLRAWARGSYGLEAATEMLLRHRGGRFARPGYTDFPRQRHAGWRPRRILESLPAAEHPERPQVNAPIFRSCQP